MRSVIMVLSLSVASISQAETKTCGVDRTPIEMAGHTLCLINTAMPSIHQNEDGSVDSLVWSHPERFPPEVKLPPGTFYLIVDRYPHIPSNLISPLLENSGPSYLPHMRETTDGLTKIRNTVRHRFHPQQARVNSQAFVLECSDAIAPRRQGLGAHDCQLISQFLSGLWIEVHLGTVDWDHAPAWPRLDETWVETWPPYLADLESGIRSLLSVQQ